jgi:3-hydroxyacyl-[acyl-carrier-protein] dehydratase
MLQSLVEAASWLLRVTEDFQHSIIVLRDAKNVKYGNFMEPGRAMRITVEMSSDSGRTAEFKGRGEMDGSQTVGARFTLDRYNARDLDPANSVVDERLIAEAKARYALLRRSAGPARAKVLV